MTAKLVCTLETAIFRAMQEKQYSAVASNAKVLMKLIGLEAKIKSQSGCFGSTRSQVRMKKCCAISIFVLLKLELNLKNKYKWTLKMVMKRLNQ